jgi:Holliday junction resolvase RusA-like endonuclease
VTGKVPAKARTRFRLDLPSVKPGQYLAWRREIQRELRRLDKQFTFPERWRLKLKARIYLPVSRWPAIDVDNCLKSLMDALQGAVTDKGRKWADRKLLVIPNDNQVYSATIVKASPGGHRKGGGYAVVQRIPGEHRPTGKRPGA